MQMQTSAWWPFADMLLVVTAFMPGMTAMLWYPLHHLFEVIHWCDMHVLFICNKTLAPRTYVGFSSFLACCLFIGGGHDMAAVFCRTQHLFTLSRLCLCHSSEKILLAYTCKIEGITAQTWTAFQVNSIEIIRLGLCWSYQKRCMVVDDVLPCNQAHIMTGTYSSLKSVRPQDLEHRKAT